MKTFYLLFGSLFLICHVAHAQFHLKANLQNMHLWRGMEVSSGMVLTTDLSYSLCNGHLVAGLWGGMNSRGSYKEFNHYLELYYRRFKLAFWDTYNFSPGAAYNNSEYFNYKAKETGRFLDATLSYSISDRFPLSISASTLLFGRDRDEANRKNRYSTFLFVSYPISMKKGWVITPGIGTAFACSPGRDSEGHFSKAHFYGDEWGIVHVSLSASYSFSLFDHPLPLTACAMWNPQSNKGFFQLGVCLFSF